MRQHGVSNVLTKLRQIEQKEIAEDKTDSIDLIINIVCAEYKIKRSDLLSRKKGVSVSESKKMAILLISENVQVTPSEIALYFNRHNRSVYRILNEYQSMTEDVKWQKDFLEKKQKLTNKIKIKSVKDSK
jgi:chromosomal replication initiation ATPase DnaA